VFAMVRGGCRWLIPGENTLMKDLELLSGVNDMVRENAGDSGGNCTGVTILSSPGAVGDPRCRRWPRYMLRKACNMARSCLYRLLQGSYCFPGPHSASVRMSRSKAAALVAGLILALVAPEAVIASRSSFRCEPGNLRKRLLAPHAKRLMTRTSQSIQLVCGSHAVELRGWSVLLYVYRAVLPQRCLYCCGNAVCSCGLWAAAACFSQVVPVVCVLAVTVQQPVSGGRLSMA
jgi:hypothetical protein